MEKIDYSEYIEKTNQIHVSDESHTKGWKFKLFRCKLCGWLFKGGGIRTHIYYKHFYEQGNKYDWRTK